MTNRVNRYLDGEIERAALTPGEQDAADTVVRAVDAARVFVASRPVPDLSGSVLRQVEQLELRPTRPLRRSPLRELTNALWVPRRVSFAVRPVYACAIAAAIALVAVLSHGEPGGLAAQPDVNVTDESKLFVQFRLQASGASRVRLAGSFTNWEPLHELHEAAPGLWTVTLPLRLGVHDYAFLVDGEQWVPDPYAPHVDDGFGGSNSRIAILPPDGQRS